MHAQSAATIWRNSDIGNPAPRSTINGAVRRRPRRSQRFHATSRTRRAAIWPGMTKSGCRRVAWLIVPPENSDLRARKVTGLVRAIQAAYRLAMYGEDARPAIDPPVTPLLRETGRSTGRPFRCCAI